MTFNRIAEPPGPPLVEVAELPSLPFDPIVTGMRYEPYPPTPLLMAELILPEVIKLIPIEISRLETKVTSFADSITNNVLPDVVAINFLRMPVADPCLTVAPAFSIVKPGAVIDNVHCVKSLPVAIVV